MIIIKESETIKDKNLKTRLSLVEDYDGEIENSKKQLSSKFLEMSNNISELSSNVQDIDIDTVRTDMKKGLNQLGFLSDEINSLLVYIDNLNNETGTEDNEETDVTEEVPEDEEIEVEPEESIS